MAAYIIMFMISLAAFMPLRAQWQICTSMPTARYGMAAVAIGEKIFAIGGAQTGRKALNTVEVYDTHTDYWDSSYAGLQSARVNFAAVLFEDEIYVFGGRDQEHLIPTIEKYDQQANLWINVGTVPTSREGLCAVTVDTCIWIIAGTSLADQLYTHVERFYPHTGRWDTLDYALNTGRVAAIAQAVEDGVYVFGGYAHEPLISFEKYSPDGGGWIMQGDMLWACGGSGGALNGIRVWIVGGQTRSGTLLNAVQNFNTDSRDWTSFDHAISIPRKNLSLVYQNNFLYALGGATKDKGLSGTDVVEKLDLIATDINVSPLTTKPSDEIILTANHPNPFNDRTSFRVYIGKPDNISIRLQNILGQTVKTIFEGPMSGWRQFTVDGKTDLGNSLSSGIYFVYLSTGSEKKIIKILYSK